MIGLVAALLGGLPAMAVETPFLLAPFNAYSHDSFAPHARPLPVLHPDQVTAVASIEHLTAVSDPFFAMIAEAKEVAAEARGWLASAMVVRAVRGRKVRTRQALFDEFATALQFPYYFGENWSAFEDCISDLDWLPFQHGVVVVVYGANEVLADEPETDLVTLIGAFSSAVADFGRVVADGEWWDRGPVPFHVVLQGASADEFERWRAAGAEIAPLPLGGRGG